MCATGGGERGVGCLRTALPEHVLACAAARQDVEHIAALPVEAAEAEAMLAQEGSLLAAYECLAMLEGTSMKAQRALESGTNVNLKEAKNLNSYFQKASKQAAQAGGSASAAPTRLPRGQRRRLSRWDRLARLWVPAHRPPTHPPPTTAFAAARAGQADHGQV